MLTDPILATPLHSSSDRNEARGILQQYIRTPACKRLINRIVTAQRDEGIQSVAVLSQFPGEGTTLFISAVALGYMTFLNRRVLILDTVSQSQDMSFYYSAIQGRANCNGVTSDTRGCIDLITTKNISRTSLPNRTTSSETKQVITSDTQLDYDSADFQVAPFIASLAHSYDLILLDTCSLSTVNSDCFDPLIMAQYVDASIIVASELSLERTAFSTMMRELKRYNISPLGFVSHTGMQQ